MATLVAILIVYIEGAFTLESMYVTTIEDALDSNAVAQEWRWSSGGLADMNTLAAHNASTNNLVILKIQLNHKTKSEYFRKRVDVNSLMFTLLH